MFNKKKKSFISPEWIVDFMKKMKDEDYMEDIPPTGRPTGKVIRETWFDNYNRNLDEIDRLSVSDLLRLPIISKKDNSFFINLDNIWHYNCRDSEKIPDERVIELANLNWNFGLSGIYYWVAKQRGYDPELKDIRERIKYVRQILREPELSLIEKVKRYVRNYLSD